MGNVSRIYCPVTVSRLSVAEKEFFVHTQKNSLKSKISLYNLVLFTIVCFSQGKNMLLLL